MPAFLCDRMLIRLGRWLRAAGHDTLIAEAETPDRRLVETALADGRLLLTRDRRMVQLRDAERCVLLLDGNRIAGWVMALNRLPGMSWLAAPFTRCMLCNAVLDEAPPSLLARVPEQSRAEAARGPLRRCAPCDRLYWRGGHTRRMLARLMRFSELR